MTRAAVAGGAAATAIAVALGLSAPSAGALAASAREAAATERSIELVNGLAQLSGLLAGGDELPAVLPRELSGLLEDFSSLDPSRALSLIDSGDVADLIGGIDFGALFRALGLNPPGLGDLLELPLDVPGVNVVTTGPPFGALGILGLNPFWVPVFPSAIAEQVNGTPYLPLDLGVSLPSPVTLLLTAALAQSPYNLGIRSLRAANSLCDQVDCGPDSFPIGLPNLRVPIVLGFGLGSLTAGMAWDRVVADLSDQPGGTAEGAEEGRSLTILTMILLRNPGRADGGIAARFAPIFRIFGINTVTPEFEVFQDLGARLVPNKVDATVEYDPLSDFAAWPNPFTLANNKAALLFPTYILRGSEAGLPEMIAQILGAALPGIAGNVAYGFVGSIPSDLEIAGVDVLNVPCGAFGCELSPAFSVPDVGPFELDVRGDLLGLLGSVVEGALGMEIPDDYFATNTYLTIEQNALPLLEPLRYPADIANLFTGGAFGFTNPFADAIEPALKLLVNLGYTNVTQDITDPLDPYPRDFSGNFGGEYAPFLSVPENIDWTRVPEDLFTALAAGVESAFFDGGIPGVRGPAAGPNPLQLLAGLLGVGDLGGLLDGIPGLGDFLDDVLEGVDVDDVVTLTDRTSQSFTPPADRAAPQPESTASGTPAAALPFGERQRATGTQLTLSTPPEQGEPPAGGDAGDENAKGAGEPPAPEPQANAPEKTAEEKLDTAEAEPIPSDARVGNGRTPGKRPVTKPDTPVARQFGKAVQNAGERLTRAGQRMTAAFTGLDKKPQPRKPAPAATGETGTGKPTSEDAG